MASVTPLKAPRQEPDERQLRVDLAAAFRMAAALGWHEAVANHFSLAVSADGKKFLMNPRRRHFARIKASDLLLLDADDPGAMRRPNAPDASAWCIHGTLHAGAPQARCILHVHPPYATAISCLADPEIKPIEQNTARFYNRVTIDRGFGGIADDNVEGERLARALGNKSIMMMGNHGVLVAGADHDGTVPVQAECVRCLGRQRPGDLGGVTDRREQPRIEVGGGQHLLVPVGGLHVIEQRRRGVGVILREHASQPAEQVAADRREES